MDRRFAADAVVPDSVAGENAANVALEAVSKGDDDDALSSKEPEEAVGCRRGVERGVDMWVSQGVSWGYSSLS